jgi:hypothetical protein
MPEPGHLAPTYGTGYGFAQGAQNDIFQTVNHSNWTCPQSTAGESQYMHPLRTDLCSNSSLCSPLVGVFPRNKRSVAVPLNHRMVKRRTFSR